MAGWEDGTMDLWWGESGGGYRGMDRGVCLRSAVLL